MSLKENLYCVISGSFSKFKPEIDQHITHFTDLGVTVLAPKKGWLYIPPQRIITPSTQSFRPLPDERHMNIRQIEDEFLRCLSQSDFVYIVNPDGYVGLTVAMEIGVAIALGIPIFSQQPIDPRLDHDLLWQQHISTTPTLPPPAAINYIKEMNRS